MADSVTFNGSGLAQTRPEGLSGHAGQLPSYRLDGKPVLTQRRRPRVEPLGGIP